MLVDIHLTALFAPIGEPLQPPFDALNLPFVKDYRLRHRDFIILNHVSAASPYASMNTIAVVPAINPHL